MKKGIVALLLHSLMLILLIFLWAKPTWADIGGTEGQKQVIQQANFPSSYFDVNVPKLGLKLNACQNSDGSLKITAECWAFMINSTITSANGIQALGNPVAVNPDGTKPEVMRPGGAAGFIASGIDMMINNKPASSKDYIAYMGNQLHVPGTPEVAYAADGGRGFNGLTPVLNIWVMMRNLAYFLFAVIFVIIGVMIMTRRKIDPKTVATVQNALPKIIFALVIVTFSYAIAGFLIDLMYVALALIVTLMNSLQDGNGKLVETLLSGSIFSFVLNGDKGLFGVSGSIAVITSGIVNNMLGIQNIPLLSDAVGAVGGGLAFLIVSIAILVALFRTWLALIGAFANIILAVIFAPLRLTMDAIPGQNHFGAWVKDLLANLLTFPLVTILLAIGSYIAAYPLTVSQAQTGFTPPLLGAGNVREVLPFVGLGILLTIPKALEILREAMKAPGFKYGSAWQQSIGQSVNANIATAKYAPNAPGVQRFIARPIRGSSLVTGVSSTVRSLGNPGPKVPDSAEVDNR